MSTLDGNSPVTLASSERMVRQDHFISCVLI
jgi:hypothetical protein